MPKFFVSPNDVRGSFLTLDGENAAHAKVLRLRRGDSVLVCDGCGTDYRCTVSDISPQQVCLVVNSTEASGAEPLVACSVYMAYAKADKLEHVIQKATELGAYEIAAFPSSRCVLKLDAASAEKRRERWQKIAASAAAQSGRGRIPQVLVLPSFEDAVQRAAGCELALFPYENEHALSLRRAIGSAQAKTVSIMTGPKADFPTKKSCLHNTPDFRFVRSVRGFFAVRLHRCARSAPSCSPPARWTDTMFIKKGILNQRTEQNDDKEQNCCKKDGGSVRCL